MISPIPFDTFKSDALAEARRSGYYYSPDAPGQHHLVAQAFYSLGLASGILSAVAAERAFSDASRISLALDAGLAHKADPSYRLYQQMRNDRFAHGVAMTLVTIGTLILLVAFVIYLVHNR